MTLHPRQQRRCLIGTVALGVLLLTACGNRLSHARAVAAAEVGYRTGDASAAAGGTAAPGVGVQSPVGTPGDPGAPAAPATQAVGVPTTTAPAGGDPVQPGVPTAAATGGPAVKPSSSTQTTAPTKGTSTSAATVASGKQDTTPVQLCQDGSFSGQAGPPFGGGQPGLAAWVRWTNAHGGLAGHPIQVDSKDDAQDNNKALQNVQTCVQSEHAVAVVAAFLPVTADAISSYVQQQKVPVIGGDALNAPWFNNPYFFPQGASGPSDAYGGVQAWKDKGKTSGAVIYCAELADCATTASVVQEAAQKQGIPIKGSYQVSIANPSFTSQCGDMKGNGVQAVYVNEDGPSLQRLARDCNAVGFHPLYTTGGLALDANAVLDDPNLEGLSVATSVFPWTTSAVPASQAFQTAMATYAPDVDPSESAAIAWTSGQLLSAAVAKLGTAAQTGPITSAMIVKGLDMIKNDTVGGLIMGQISFTTGQANAKRICWGAETLSGGKWSAPLGATAKCA